MNNFVTDWDNIVITCINHKITKPPSKTCISLNSKIFATVVNSSSISYKIVTKLSKL